MALAGLNIELNADIAKFSNAIDKAAYLAEKSGKQMEAAFQAANAHVKILESGIKGLGTSLGALGVIGGAGAFVGMIKGSVETAAEFKRLSESTGVSVSALSAMSGTAKLVGIDMNAVGLMVSKLDKAMWAAQGGNKAAIQSFQKIGVSALEAGGSLRNSEDVMLDVAKKMADMESGAARTGLAIELFGKKGAQMIPFLLELAEKGNLTGKITDKQAESAERLEKAWLKFQKSMNGWKFDAMEAIAPALERLIPVFPYLIEGAIAFIGVVKLLPMAINGVTATINIMSTMFGLAGVTGVGVFGSLTAAVNTFTAALIANPITAIAVGITAAAAAAWLFQDKLISLSGTTASLGNWIGAVWDAVKDSIVGAWSYIHDKLSWMFDGIEWAASKAEKAIDRLNSMQKSREQWAGKKVSLGPANQDDGPSISSRAAERQAIDDAAAEAAKPKTPKFSPINTGDGIVEKIDPFQKALSNMEASKSALQWGVDHWKEYKNGIEASKEAMAKFEVESGKFSDAERAREGRSALSNSEKQKYIDAGKALDELTARQKDLNDLIKFNNETDKQAADHKAMLSAAQQEIQMRGMGTLEAQNLKIQLQEQLKLEERINSLLKDKTLTEKERNDSISKARAESMSYSQGAQGINSEKYLYDRSANAGFSRGFNQITDGATNSAQQIQSVMSTAFNGASDALANFVKTGKMNFASLGTSIIDMCIKIASQKFIGELMNMGMSAFGGGFSGGYGSATEGSANFIGPMLASGGGLSGGQTSIVGENGPELFIPNSSGTVIPNHQVRQAISGTSSSGGNQFNGDVNVIINSNGQSTTNNSGSMADLGTQIGAIVQQHLITQMRPGGLLAAA